MFRRDMTIAVKLNLTDDVARKAKEKGLLQPDRLGALVVSELIKGDNGEDFFAMMRRIQAVPGEPMSAAEIQREIKAARAERRKRRENRS